MPARRSRGVNTIVRGNTGVDTLEKKQHDALDGPNKGHWRYFHRKLLEPPSLTEVAEETKDICGNDKNADHKMIERGEDI